MDEGLRSSVFDSELVMAVVHVPNAVIPIPKSNSTSLLQNLLHSLTLKVLLHLLHRLRGPASACNDWRMSEKAICTGSVPPPGFVDATEDLG